MTIRLPAGLALAACLVAGGATAQAPGPTQGVSANQITLGTIQDLSGPLAAYGKQTRNGLQMYFDELNARGGIHGRRVNLIVEDSAYDPRKALLAAQKLVNSDRIFMMVGHIGTAQNMAAMPVQFERNVPNFMPVTAAREMYLPPQPLKMAFATAYYDQLHTMLPGIVRERGLKRACVVYQDDEFGLEVVRGGEAALQTLNQTYVERASFKRGATEFSSQVARLKAANCDLVVMGTIIRETVGVLAEAKKVGLEAVFVGTSAAYTHLIPQLGGAVAEGFYAMMTTAHPYPDDPSPQIREWAQRYKARFGEDPTVFSAYGWQIGNLFYEAAMKAGQSLTVESFLRAIEQPYGTDMFDSQGCRITAQNRLCNNSARLSQIRNGRWVIIGNWVHGATPTH
ncbi:ABC transporter substrate-binding protein [Phreatobacter sp. AB_2022a]|uniref:ABC transporter substrate-binding protein n=1 Tax=Phreatobacter sp. AB_2022a TaxID=3003134 RepID=UPI0022872F65|nr:ABC transporter substrate-binding protein [Phreatobacter sp. AB_2022a]MCZ0737391.1 ABC transporter substrate-binding protein [Phreatobacter sp. AB_2022a]